MKQSVFNLQFMMRRAKAWLKRIRENPAYARAVFSGYALMASNVAVQILLVPLYVRTLGKYQFGVLMLILATMNYAQAGIGWASGGIQRVLGELYFKDSGGLFGNAYAISRLIFLVYALLASAILSSVALFWAPDGLSVGLTVSRADMILLCVSASAYFVVLYDLSIARTVLTATNRQASANSLTILMNLFFVCLVIPFLRSGHGVAAVFIAYFVSASLARIVAYLPMKNLGVQLPLLPHHWRHREIWSRITGKTGVGYLLYGALLLTLQSDALLVGWIAGPIVVGEFVLVWKVADILVQLLWRFPDYLQPEIVRLDVLGRREQLGRLYRVFYSKMALLSVGAGLGYALLGRFVVRLWVGASNAPGDWRVYALAGVAVAFLSVARLPSIYCYALVRMRRLLKVMAGEVVLKILIIVPLYRWIGLLAPFLTIDLVHGLWAFFAYRGTCREFMASERVEAGEGGPTYVAQ